MVVPFLASLVRSVQRHQLFYLSKPESKKCWGPTVLMAGRKCERRKPKVFHLNQEMNTMVHYRQQACPSYSLCYDLALSSNDLCYQELLCLETSGLLWKWRDVSLFRAWREGHPLSLGGNNGSRYCEPLNFCPPVRDGGERQDPPSPLCDLLDSIFLIL